MVMVCRVDLGLSTCGMVCVGERRWPLLIWNVFSDASGVPYMGVPRYAWKVVWSVGVGGALYAKTLQGWCQSPKSGTNNSRTSGSIR